MAANSTWGGRFAAPTSSLCAEFTESQSFDRALADQDIRGSIAHARMLGRQKILPAKEVEAILTGLEKIRQEIESGSFQWDPALEDVHMNIENRLVRLIGETGKKLHTGRSRNDQVGLAFRLFVAEACESWQQGCLALCEILVRVAGRERGVIMPGFTHLQPAQPVSLAQHLLAWAGMLKRDWERIADALARIRISPLGAAALAGSTFPLNPNLVAEEVGFPQIYANSMDAVSDRDFVLEALFCASMIMEHLSRMAEELILWATPAFGYIRLPDAFSTGSSIMPQKRNPDVAELLRGKTGRVYGSLMALLTTMKGLPLAYNRDMQEDKESFLDADKTVADCLRIMTAFIDALVFQPEKMLAACKLGYINATELADYLAARGIPFRDAHHITGNAVAYAEKSGKALEELTLAELRQFSEKIEEDIYAALSYESCVARRETSGGTGPASVARQIRDFENWLASRP